MKVKLINRYILKEIIPNYFIGLGFLSVILFVAQIFKMVQMVVEQNVKLFLALKLLVLYIPLILQFTLPISVVLGVILAVSRFSDDSEIIAMRACGVSLLRVFLPAIAFGFLANIFILIFYEYILPFSIKQYAQTKIEIYQINPTAQLVKNLSYRSIDGIKITIDAVNPKTNELINVRINYINENRFIFARKALLLSKDFKKNAFPLILFNSTVQPANLQNPKVSDQFNEQFNAKQTIYIPDRKSSEIIPEGVQLLSLSQLQEQLENRSNNLVLYNLRDYNRLKENQVLLLDKEKELQALFLKKPVKNNSPEFQQYSQLLLNKKIEKKKISILIKRFQRILKQRNLPESKMALLEDEYLFHRKIAFSFAALAFSILGSPLGIFSKRTGKSMGFGMSILLISIFFILVFLGNLFLKKHFISSFLAAWLPNIVLFILGIFFIFYRLNSWNSIFDIIKFVLFRWTR